MPEINNEHVFYAASSAQYELTDKGDGKTTLVGYPVVWGAMSDVRKDGNRHRFAKGSVEFRQPTRALYAHAGGSIIGSTANKTLRIAPDDRGIKVEIDLPNTTLGRDVANLVKDGYVKGMSIGGSIAQSYATNGVRDLKKFMADEVTVTDDPAMQATSVTVMSAEHATNYEKDLLAMKEHKKEVSKLNKYKLKMLELGKVSGSA